jgi:hypothetical protein
MTECVNWAVYFQEPATKQREDLFFVFDSSKKPRVLLRGQVAVWISCCLSPIDNVRSISRMENPAADAAAAASSAAAGRQENIHSLRPFLDLQLLCCS